MGSGGIFRSGRREGGRPAIPPSLGVGLPQAGPEASPENLARFAVGTEELGFDSVWVFEQLLRPTRSFPVGRAAELSVDHVFFDMGMVGVPLATQLRFMEQLMERLHSERLRG